MVKYCCKCEQHVIILNNHCAIDHLITLIVPSLFPRESSGGSDLERSPSGRGRPPARRPERRLGDRQWWLESSRWLSMVLVFLPTKLADWLIFHILFGQMLVNIPAPWEHMGIVITCLPKQISAYRGQFMSGPNQDVFSGFSGCVCVLVTLFVICPDDATGPVASGNPSDCPKAPTMIGTNVYKPCNYNN